MSIAAESYYCFSTKESRVRGENGWVIFHSPSSCKKNIDSLLLFRKHVTFRKYDQ